ncbi:hypothetical protein LINGRAHAP2_LOCUS33486 [Linum grandiflorum]
MYPANSPYDGSPFPLKRGASRPQAWSEFADPAANYGFHPRPRYHRNPNYAPARTPTWSEFADPAANYGFHPRPRYHGNPNYAPARTPSVNHGQGNSTHRPNLGYGGHQFPSSGGRWHRGGGGRSQGGRWHGGSKGRGRGRDFQNRDSKSSEKKQDLLSFYDDSMVEDPWKGLEPIEWRGIIAKPSSIGKKRPRSPKSSNSEQSLAEDLASSFNEAPDAEQNT